MGLWSLIWGEKEGRKPNFFRQLGFKAQDQFTRDAKSQVGDAYRERRAQERKLKDQYEEQEKDVVRDLERDKERMARRAGFEHMPAGRQREFAEQRFNERYAKHEEKIRRNIDEAQRDRFKGVKREFQHTKDRIYKERGERGRTSSDPRRAA